MYAHAIRCLCVCIVCSRLLIFVQHHICPLSLYKNLQSPDSLNLFLLALSSSIARWLNHFPLRPLQTQDSRSISSLLSAFLMPLYRVHRSAHPNRKTHWTFHGTQAKITVHTMHMHATTHTVVRKRMFSNECAQYVSSKHKKWSLEPCIIDSCVPAIVRARQQHNSKIANKTDTNLDLYAHKYARECKH